MNTNIFKYTLDNRNEMGECKVEVSFGAELLNVVEQDNNIVAYFLEHPLYNETERYPNKEFMFLLAFTGVGTLPPATDYVKNGEWKYINTVSLDGGSLMVHVFTPVKRPHTYDYDEIN